MSGWTYCETCGESTDNGEQCEACENHDEHAVPEARAEQDLENLSILEELE